MDNEHAECYQKIEAEKEFQAQLERQFGKRAVEMRYRMNKSEYDLLTMQVYQDFLEAHELPAYSDC
ncbi:MAG: hypothetical protein AAF702_01700 [Chloroflexota bacterium]